VLEAIGAKRRSDVMKTDAPGVNYQESVSVPLSEEADNNVATQEGDDRTGLVDEDPDSSVDPKFVLPVVNKESPNHYIPFSLGSQSSSSKKSSAQFAQVLSRRHTG